MQQPETQGTRQPRPLMPHDEPHRFSVAATSLQWLIERVGWLSPMMLVGSWTLGGLILILAGLYQLTPAKRACLRGCQNPVRYQSI